MHLAVRALGLIFGLDDGLNDAVGPGFPSSEGERLKSICAK
jgi:hypothetical protein